MKSAAILLAAGLLLTASAAKPPVPDAVLNQFTAVFPAATNVLWHEDGDGYEVSFESESIRCFVRYGPDGKTAGSRRFCSGSSLSPFLRLKIAQRYPGKSIFGVTEVNNESGLTYHVVLEDETTWIQVAVDPTGDPLETKKFRKAPK